jgi:DUF4097 and DUF4098 domain-containing protein YvlB
MSTRPALPTALRQPHVVLETTAGQRITLDDASASILIQDTSGNSIRLDHSGITISASAKVTIQATQAELSVSMLTVDAAMAKFSGVVQADTLIANSVIASSYTPGAGNLW